MTIPVDHSGPQIQWIRSLKDALTTAKRETKFVMMDVFNPG